MQEKLLGRFFQRLINEILRDLDDPVALVDLRLRLLNKRNLARVSASFACLHAALGLREGGAEYMPHLAEEIESCIQKHTHYISHIAHVASLTPGKSYVSLTGMLEIPVSAVAETEVENSEAKGVRESTHS